MDDGIANGTYEPRAGEPQPLALFTAPRVDYSLHRLRHYTGTAPEHFQNFVLFTNYQFYIDEFVRLGHEAMARRRAAATTPRSSSRATWSTRRSGHAGASRATSSARAPPRLPQMPAYHLMRADGSGITMVNIGVGPANAKTITDHIAVLRPHAWMMLGHCAGLRNTQQLGDYVLAHGYVREDHVLDEELPLWVPIPALAEVQVALEEAVAEVTQLQGLRAEADHAHRHRGEHRQPQLGAAAVAQCAAASAASARAARSRSTWKARRSPPTASASAFPTARCCASATSRCTARSSCRAWRTTSTASGSTSICASACARSSSCAQAGVDQLHSRKLRSFAEVAFQ